MKKLQNNFTTPEQSKRLLELGVPADSADCIMKDNEHVYKYNFDAESTITELVYRLNVDDYSHGYIPCWSVGRLVEIYLLCAELKKPQMIFIKEDVLMMDRMINELCHMAESERLDFSKLEE